MRYLEIEDKRMTVKEGYLRRLVYSEEFRNWFKTEVMNGVNPRKKPKNYNTLVYRIDWSEELGREVETIQFKGKFEDFKDHMMDNFARKKKIVITE